MKLYSIDFEHWGPKSSQAGIKGYLVAENDEQVLDWFLENKDFGQHSVRTWWKDSIESVDTTRERLLEHKVELYDEERLEGLSDLFYGATLFGWQMVSEVNILEVASLIKLGVAKMARP